MEMDTAKIPNSDLLTNDALQLTKFLPEEIWEVILNKLGSPTQKCICSNASPFFRDLLLNKRTQFLFPEVLDILLKSEGLDRREDGIAYGVELNHIELSEQISMQNDWERMKNEWEADELKNTDQNGNQHNSIKLDLQHCWLQLETGWETVLRIRNIVQQTLEFTQRHQHDGFRTWIQKLNMCQQKVYESWRSMNTCWGIIECNRNLGETFHQELYQIERRLRIIRDNAAQIRSIRDWVLTLPNLRLVCQGWNQAIQVKLTGNM